MNEHHFQALFALAHVAAARAALTKHPDHERRLELYNRAEAHAYEMLESLGPTRAEAKAKDKK